MLKNEVTTLVNLCKQQTKIPEALACLLVPLHHAQVPWANAVLLTVFVHSIGDTEGFNTDSNSDFYRQVYNFPDRTYPQAPYW